MEKSTTSILDLSTLLFKADGMVWIDRQTHGWQRGAQAKLLLRWGVGPQSRGAGCPEPTALPKCVGGRSWRRRGAAAAVAHVPRKPWRARAEHREARACARSCPPGCCGCPGAPARPGRRVRPRPDRAAGAPTSRLRPTRVNDAGPRASRQDRTSARPEPEGPPRVAPAQPRLER